MDELKNFLRQRAPGGILLAFSGGVDSAFLLFLLSQLRRELPFPLLAATMHSVFQKNSELDAARHMAAAADVEWMVFSCDVLDIPEVAENSPARCYHCKHAIFSQFTREAARRGLQTIFDGTNADDACAYRPGLAALRQLHVVSPLLELGISKRDVRKFSAEIGLDCAQKPSSACLATRFEYGTHLTGDALKSVSDGEEYLRSLLPTYADLRLRRHGKIGRIEVSPEFFPLITARAAEIVQTLQSFGFPFVSLDLNGFHSGSMDKDDNP